MNQDFYYHNLDWKEVAKLLGTNIDSGLSSEEVKIRQRKIGLNKISKEKPFLRIKIFLDQFRSPLIYILIIAGIITYILKEFTDSLVIFLAVFINAIFGFWEEYKVSKVLEKLKKTIKTKTIVLREGKKQEIFLEELVPGDIIFLKAGDKVPADARLIEARNLKVSEAILTGEWLPSLKTTKILPKDTHLADRENMIYLGCLVESGEGKAVVVATGKNTETGKIATLLKETKEEKTPLQKKLVHFSKIIGVLIGIICIFIFIGGSLREKHILEMFESSVAIAVGGIPEALPIVMTLVLVIGMQRILKKRGLIRKLSSVETLGSTQIICFDKTRTLTQGKMEVAEIFAEDKNLTLKIGILCNECFIENPEEEPEKWRIKGSPTDSALIKGGIKKGFLKPELEKHSIQLDYSPFDSKLKYQLSLRKEGNKIFLYISGAPERILEISNNKDRWGEKLKEMTQKGLRVIGVGYKEMSNLKSQISNANGQILKILDDKISGIHFAGLIGLKDPLRNDVKEAVEVCKKAGMKPILVTGDYKLTAKAVANEIGLKVKDDEILEGRELEKISQKEFEEILEKIKIYARVEPKHKLRIIEAWQKKGKVVAMTGDGVNDTPALKKADIGIALGSGTESAKEVSDLVLLDDSFSAIIKAIEEGRVIIDNLRKAISYILADSFTSVILVGVGTVIFGWPLPVLPVQILWNNFVEDTLPDIAYAFEPKEKDVMKEKPLPLKAPLLNKEMKVLIFGTGLIDEFIILGLFWWLWKYLHLDLDYVRTLIFGSICIDTAFVIYCYKSLKRNIWRINLFSNKWLIFSSISVFFFYAAAIYLPPLQKILHTVPLDFFGWVILVSIGIISMFLIEVTKWYFISRHETEI
ncbi:HAD-IC family P-type ATPase [bacterium]|nr:HAD-IC family P-type ATPase [bacterium]